MAFTLKLDGEALRPTIRCDRCGADVPSSGFQLWRPTGDRAAGDCHSAQLCGEDCLDAWLFQQPDADEWLAVPLDAYLANLIVALEVDVAAVLEREQAVWAAEHTRHEAPD
jgi:hypothetical protein